jgi:hypothetical protein
MSDKQRTFTVQGSDIGFQGGTYKSTTTPVVAARKAARMLFRVIKHAVAYKSDPVKFKAYKKYAKFAEFKNEKSIKMLLREKTKGGEGHSFYYEATMKKLSSPVIVTRNGKEIKIETEVDVKVCKDPHDHHVAPPKKAAPAKA